MIAQQIGCRGSVRLARRSIFDLGAKKTSVYHDWLGLLMVLRSSPYLTP